MTTFRYILRSILHYRRQHLSLFMGIALTAAVLTGALVAGDSIRHSLKQIVTLRLGNTRSVIIGGSRYMETGLAQRLEKLIKAPVIPLLLHKGIVIEPDSGIRVNEVGIIGIDSTFNAITFADMIIPGEDEVVVGANLADRLHVESGDNILLRVAGAGLIPVNAPFSKESPPARALRMTIKAIANEEQLSRFNLSNNQSDVYNVFISSGQLNQLLEMTSKTNILLIADREANLLPDSIENALEESWTPEDMGLRMTDRGDGSFDLISERIFIDTVIQRKISESRLPHQKIVTYMVNDIRLKEKRTPYSFASALQESMTGSDPGEEGVMINKWTAEDLGAVVGDSVTLSWYEIGPLRELREKEQKFRISSIIPNRTIHIDSSLMPKFPGLSEAGNCRDWDAGVPIDLKRIRDKDEKYWDEYRGTPKVILSLATGERLWANQFGTLTAIRFQESAVSKDKLRALITEKIKPSDLGFQVIDLKLEGVTAAENAVNFTELFLGMSFFVIAAALLLTLLLYSLHFNSRTRENGLLSGLGFDKKLILRLRINESLMVIVTGSIAGSLLGVVYNSGIIAALNTIWNDMVRTDLLTVHIRITILFAGAAISMLMAAVPVYFVTAKKLKLSVAAQLISGPSIDSSYKTRAGRGLKISGSVFASSGLIIAVYGVVAGAVNNAAMYLTSAGLLLTGAILYITGILRNQPVKRDSLTGTCGLAFRNLQRNPARSLSVVTLLAIGTFSLIITGANRKTFYGSETNKSSGTGGFQLWAETTSPVPFNLNTAEGRSRLLINDDQDLAGVHFLQFKRLDGDDASCLNLNQAQRPRILAVNAMYLDSARAFSFGRLLPGIPEDSPWMGLENAYNDSVFPAYADQNVIQYSLQRKLGDTLFYLAESGRKFGLVLAGSIRNSVFQGNLIISEEVFRNQFPSSGGSRTMLIDAPQSKQTLISEILTQSLTDYGIEVMPTSRRLATFNSVENTYLTVFMALSGLGFLIGTIGLGIVLLRNIQERKRELALMLAVGYRKRQLFRLVFTENLYLLTAGWCIGMLAALTGILPSLFSPAFDLHGGFIILLLLVILISGLLWIYFPLQSALRKPLIQALRNE